MWTPDRALWRRGITCGAGRAHVDDHPATAYCNETSVGVVLPLLPRMTLLPKLSIVPLFWTVVPIAFAVIVDPLTRMVVGAPSDRNPAPPLFTRVELCTMTVTVAGAIDVAKMASSQNSTIL